jgi:DHA1 family multidrug resistance protein-like MFS transporter
MSALIRDAPIGQVIRWATRNKMLKYPEEEEGWTCPSCYNAAAAEDHEEPRLPDIEKEELREPTEPTIEEGKAFVEPAEEVDPEKLPVEELPEVEQVVSQIETSSSSSTSGASHHEQVGKELHQIPTAAVGAADRSHLETIKTSRTTTGLEKVGTRSALQQSRTRADLEQAFTASTLKPGPSAPIIPATLEDGTILVDWYTTDDPENPQNWNLSKKLFVTFQICAYTLAVYMGSAIYAPSEGGIMQQFGVNQQLASMGLSMYVLAYGMGPMLWSPLSEMPVIGRNPPYMITYALFVILLVPTALVENFPGLIVLRFLLGFFGSPCLATGGATLQDMFSLIKLPYVLSTWALAATCGPALGPIISGFSVAAENWRWSQWELLWLAGPIWILMFLCLPETSPSNILLRRARRLRKLTGDSRLKAQSEIDQANISVSHLVRENLLRPNQMMLLDPAIGFTAVYTALVYGIYYSFFEVFPIVYIDMYGFSLGTMGLCFLSVTVGVIVAIACYWSYVYWVVEPEIRAHGLGPPERRLIPALVAAFLCPIGLFLFGTSPHPPIKSPTELTKYA